MVGRLKEKILKLRAMYKGACSGNSRTSNDKQRQSMKQHFVELMKIRSSCSKEAFASETLKRITMDVIYHIVSRFREKSNEIPVYSVKTLLQVLTLAVHKGLKEKVIDNKLVRKVLFSSKNTFKLHMKSICRI